MSNSSTKLTNSLIRKFRRLRHQPQQVALALSGGGARGFAHIGAIEVLLERGYNITSIAGTSMGALVGGLYAAGRFPELKSLVMGLDKKQVLQIMDISLGLDHIASGQKLMSILDDLIDNERIEELPVKFCCSASDVVSGQEVVFRDGSLKQAIRASISIPCFFKPVSSDGHIYVDGSVHNTLPLDRVERKKGDLLVAVNASAPDDEPYHTYLKRAEPRTEAEKSIRQRLPFLKIEFSENYLNMALRVARLSVQNNTLMALRLTPPDIYAALPMNRFSIFDFDKAEEIIGYGRDEMNRRLDDYET